MGINIEKQLNLNRKIPVIVTYLPFVKLYSYDICNMTYFAKNHNFDFVSYHDLFFYRITYCQCLRLLWQYVFLNTV